MKEKIVNRHVFLIPAAKHDHTECPILTLWEILNRKHNFIDYFRTEKTEYKLHLLDTWVKNLKEAVALKKIAEYNSEKVIFFAHTPKPENKPPFIFLGIDDNENQKHIECSWFYKLYNYEIAIFFSCEGSKVLKHDEFKPCDWTTVFNRWVSFNTEYVLFYDKILKDRAKINIELKLMFTHILKTIYSLKTPYEIKSLIENSLLTAENKYKNAAAKTKNEVYESALRLAATIMEGNKVAIECRDNVLNN